MSKEPKVRQVVDRITGMPASDGAGVRLTRMIGAPGCEQLDPFLLFDVFRSDDPDDYIAGFPPHPHRGFETVTYMLAGRMRHRDNAGNEGIIESGGIQWMTAGRGIVHSEMPEQQDGLMWGTQLWVNLPAQSKMTAPGYQEFGASRIPVERHDDGVTVKVIAGRTATGTEGVIGYRATQPLYFDVFLPPGRSHSESLPRDHSAFVFVVEGRVAIGDDPVEAGTLAILGAGTDLPLATGDVAGRLLLIAGRPLEEPVARAGPFVMNTQAELRRAYVDYQSGRF